jgi:hypothetical protein
MKKRTDLHKSVFASPGLGGLVQKDGAASPSLEDSVPGSPSGSGPTAIVALSRRRQAVVDADLARRVQMKPWRWRLRAHKPQAYCLVFDGPGERPREVLMHHLVLGLAGGETVIHRNHNGLDNRRANLQVATKGEAAAHAKTRGSEPGVWWDSADSQWHAEVVGLTGVSNLGTFDSDALASEAVRAARRSAAVPMTVAKLLQSMAEAEAPTPQSVAVAHPLPMPRSSVPPRKVRAPTNNTGIAGVTYDCQANGYIVRVGKTVRRIKTRAQAAALASDLITELRQMSRTVGPREVVTKLGRFGVLVDVEVAAWLWRTGTWQVRRRTDRTLEVRRSRPGRADPDAHYLTAARYLYGAGPEERVEFINGDQLDLRVANLRLVAAPQKKPPQPKAPKVRPKLSDDYKKLQELTRQWFSGPDAELANGRRLASSAVRTHAGHRA